MNQALLITNLAAKTVSEGVKHVIIKALSADLKLDVADTEARGHATELARDAAERDFDLVIAFGGDGTMNEVANGLVGSETAMAVLPGGMANVFSRTIGVPNDIVEATGYLLNRIQTAKTKKINVGRIDGRYFVFSCGVGLDAATVRKVESKPERKQRFGEWFFLYSAIRTGVKEYRGKRPPLIHIQSGEVSDEVVLAVVTKLPNLTFFKKWPVKIAPRARRESGFDVVALRRLPMAYVPRLLWSVFTTGSHIKYKHTLYLNDVDSVTMATRGAPFPIQVDGEYVGDRSTLNIELLRDALWILD